jgi:hypothetical protein
VGLSEEVGEAKYGGDGVGSIDLALMIGWDGMGWDEMV